MSTSWLSAVCAIYRPVDRAPQLPTLQRLRGPSAGQAAARGAAGAVAGRGGAVGGLPGATGWGIGRRECGSGLHSVAAGFWVSFRVAQHLYSNGQDCRGCGYTPLGVCHFGCIWGVLAMAHAIVVQLRLYMTLNILKVAPSFAISSALYIHQLYWFCDVYTAVLNCQCTEL